MQALYKCFDEGRMATLGHGGVRKANLAARTGPQVMGAPGLGQFLGKYMIIWYTAQFLNQRRFTDTTLATP